MNKQRRKAIRNIQDELTQLFSRIEDIKAELETVRDEEQEAYDNMPESLQNGEKGEAAQNAISQLESAIEAFSNLDEVDGYLDSAAE